MAEVAAPRPVTPQEAQKIVQRAIIRGQVTQLEVRLAHTVATEPKRTNEAIIHALRVLGDSVDQFAAEDPELAQVLKEFCHMAAEKVEEYVS